MELASPYEVIVPAIEEILPGAGCKVFELFCELSFDNAPQEIFKHIDVEGVPTPVPVTLKMRPVAEMRPTINGQAVVSAKMFSVLLHKPDGYYGGGSILFAVCGRIQAEGLSLLAKPALLARITKEQVFVKRQDEFVSTSPYVADTFVLNCPEVMLDRMLTDRDADRLVLDFVKHVVAQWRTLAFLEDEFQTERGLRIAKALRERFGTEFISAPEIEEAQEKS